MVEPLAAGILNTILPRPAAIKHSSSSLRRAVNGKARVSLSANFFTPTPRCDKGKAKATEDTSSFGDEILGCQSWAQPIEKKEVWSQDGFMRNALKGELQECRSSSVGRVHKTSMHSRRRFHYPALSAVASSSQNQADSMRFSTTISSRQLSPTQPAPFKLDASANRLLNDLIRRLKYPDTTDHAAKMLDQAYLRALQSGMFETLPPAEALHLMSSLADMIDTLCVKSLSRDVVSEWANRMEELRRKLPLATLDTLKKEDEWKSLMCRTLSLKGRLEKAYPIVRASLTATRNNQHCRKALDTYLVAMARYRALPSALEYWSTDEMKGRLVGLCRFGELIARHPDLREALMRVRRMENRPREEAIYKYALKMALFYNNGVQGAGIFDLAKKKGIELHIEYQLQLCRLLAKQGDLNGAKELLQKIPPHPSLSSYSQTKLYLYARLGDVKVTEVLMEDRRLAGTLTMEDRTNLLIALSKGHHVKEMKAVFEANYPATPTGDRMPRPPLNQYTICILENARLGNVDEVNWWLQDMAKNSMQPDLLLFTSLLTLFRKLGDDNAIMQTYQNMIGAGIQPDARVYTVMFAHFADRKDIKSANALFMDALKRGVVPDERMTASLMNAHAQAGSWREVLSIFESISNRGEAFKPHISVYNVILKANLLLGAPFKVMSALYLVMKKTLGLRPNQHTYAILVTSACESGNVGVGLDIVRSIRTEQQKGGRNDLLSVHTMTILMSTFLRIGDKVAAKEVLDEMVALGLAPTNVTYAQILKRLEETGEEEDRVQAAQLAERLLKTPDELDRIGGISRKKQPLSTIYVELLTAPALAGNFEEVERLAQEFFDASGRPTIAIYHRLLLAYRNAGELEKAHQTWPLIWELAEREPALKEDSEEADAQIEAEAEADAEKQVVPIAHIQGPFSIYMDVLSKSGMHKELADLWYALQQRGFAFDSQNWNFLVVALIRAGQVERAFQVMEQVILPNRTLNERNKNMSLRYRIDRFSRIGIKRGFRDPVGRYNKVSQGNPMWGSKDRVRLQRLDILKGRHRSKAVDLQTIDKDFTYPIRVLEFVRPGWNDWFPHEVVRRTLLIVWLLLRRGYVPKPLVLGGELVDNVVPHEFADKNIEAASELLRIFRSKYPLTTRLIFRFQIREVRRTEQFRGTRGWLSKTAFREIYLRQ